MGPNHFAERHDIERAKKRAQLAVQAGIHAYPLCSDEVWSAEMMDVAQTERVFGGSWQAHGQG